MKKATKPVRFKNVLSLFDGISCGQIALNRAGIKFDEYYASEIDKDSIRVAQHNYPNTVQVGDVKNLNKKDLPTIDLLIGGGPCQGFSMAGKQLNFEDPRSKLFFEFLRHNRQLKPKYFLFENNPMKKEYQDTISGYLGVQPIVINSSLVSAQNRKRLYWTNIPVVGLPEDRNIMLKDIIGKYVGIWVWPRGFNKGGIQGYKGKSPTITTSSWEHNFLIQKTKNCKECKNIAKEKVKQGFKKCTKCTRKFSISEVEQLQTLPVNYTNIPILSDGKKYRLIGNAWTVDVIVWILSFI